VCRAIALAAKNDENFEIFNIGSGQNILISDLVALMQKIAKTNLSLVVEERRRPNQIMETLADISKAKRILQWSPQISIEDGLKDILQA
jgi:nucleoside-diphosphate-sugar epimerase